MGDQTIFDTTTASTDHNFVADTSAHAPLADCDPTVTEKCGVPNLVETGYDCIRYMGVCNGGFVYLGRSRKGLKDHMAIKRFTIDSMVDYEMISREASNMRLLNHQNILALENCFVYENSIYMISPAMNLGSLHDILINYRKWGISENAAIGIFGQVLNGLLYIHEKRYIHRDIRPQHILVDQKGNVKVTGFRFMIELNYRLDSVFEFDAHLQNQIYYFAPEVLAQNMHGYGVKSDIYMIGISLCECLNGLIPFVEAEPLEMLHRKLNGQAPRPVDATSLEDDEKMGIDISERPKEHTTRRFSPELHNFVSKCLLFDTDKRYSTREALDSSWLSGKSKKVSPSDILESLELKAEEFEFNLWRQEPLIPLQYAQKYDVAFDYSSLS